MPNVPFGPLVAYDPTTNSLVPNASGVVYSVTDLDLARPLTLLDASGLTVTEVRSSDIGVLDEFIVSDGQWQLEVLWVSGPYRIVLSSYRGLIQRTEAAEQVADTSAATAFRCRSASLGGAV